MKGVMTPTAPPLSRLPPPDADRWLESLPAPVLGVDAGERIRFVNAAAADLLAAAGRGLLGRRLVDVFGHDAPLVSLARRALQAQAHVAEGDVAMAGIDFTLGRAAVAAAPVGENGYLALVIHMQGKARIGGGGPLASVSAARTLAHEVRNPLAGIRAAAQLISRSDDPDTIALGTLIVEEVDRINRLTDRIDPLDSIAPTKLERVNIHQALERVRQIIAAGFPMTIIKERYDPSLPDIRGDLDQLIQALLNIAKNGAEVVAAQDDGAISFTTRYRPGLKVRSAATGAARAQLEILISDNGPGVHPAIADRLFEPFATTKNGGMGLGLTVAADIISRHDGRIEIDSAPGATTFRVLLPIDPEEE
ncbi:MAG: nitrogen regulation protein NR(II) [Hyphomonadaceae bacterium]